VDLSWDDTEDERAELAAGDLLTGVAAELADLAADVGPEWDGGGLAVRLPEEHAALLCGLNGFTVARGGLRVLGVRDEPYLDLRQWNSPELWKFAWGTPPTDWFVIAEDGFGNQFAYRSEEGAVDVGGPVHWLDHVDMAVGGEIADFPTFLEEVLRVARRPVDPDMQRAIVRFGGLAASRHWVYAPALALGGPQVTENLMTLPAVTAMVIGGDLDRQIEEHPTQDPVRVVPAKDEQGRDRLELVYAEDS